MCLRERERERERESLPEAKMLSFGSEAKGGYGEKGIVPNVIFAHFWVLWFVFFALFCLFFRLLLSSQRKPETPCYVFEDTTRTNTLGHMPN